MKKFVAFLLALIIFVTPITTLVKADVVIGDNDNIVINENATILGRKLAMLESLSELALSGVTEFTISNTEDVDSYLDSLWDEINNAIDYLDSGDWVDDIPDNIASKYYTNLVNYRNIVNNRGEFLGFDLQNPATSLLKTYFANDTYGKKYTSTNLYGSLDTFRALSATRGGPVEPDIPPDFSFLNNINKLYVHDTSRGDDLRDVLSYGSFWVRNQQNLWNYQTNSYSYIADDFVRYKSHLTSVESNASYQNSWVSSPITIYVTTTPTINVIYSSINYYPLPFNNYSEFTNFIPNRQLDGYLLFSATLGTRNNYQRNDFDSISVCLNYIYQHYANINLYVDDVPYAIMGGGSVLTPTIDIDGLLKLYGNDNPIQYELQPNTQIDYDQLYQVIYNAIRDNLPISQGDINYYDSHNTIYSPTIINNYGEEEGEESDLIDTILDYAVIPKFDTSIAQPMRQALTNGVVIMNNSITNVIPKEILLILGACFFLLLFAVVINRMIK